jgi:hypothetical protein
MASSAVCVGKNCELLDTILASKGIPLGVVLNEIQGNIIDPILDSQMTMATWENGMLDFSPAGSPEGLKVTMWGGTSWDNVPVNGKLFGTKYSSEYSTGAMSLGGAVEYPLSRDTELILNAGVWRGPTDYGLSIVRGTSEETTIRLGGGLKHYIERWNSISVYFAGGLILGGRHAKIDFEGTNVRISMNQEVLGWRGVESYEERAYFFSTPMMLGGNVKIWDITLSADVGARLVSQIGSTQVGKYGPVGPFFGTTGYYNIGISSDRDITTMQIWPILRFGIEWNPISKVSILGNWQPKIDKYPNQVSGGIGWQFLKVDH